MFHGKILVGWIMLKENFRRFVLRPILTSIPPLFFPMQPQGVAVWKHVVYILDFIFVYQFV
jgi:hypothetical protein